MPLPEARLPMAHWGGPLFIISIFWLGWTSYPSISIWVPMMAGLPLGISLVFLFVSAVVSEKYRPPDSSMTTARSNKLYHRYISASRGIGVGGNDCGPKFVWRCIPCKHSRSLEVFEVPLIFQFGCPAVRESNVRGTKSSHRIDCARCRILPAGSSAVLTPQMGSRSAQEK